jgi:antitoxin VapB
MGMALNIKSAEVERLAEEIAALTGESKTQAVREALKERRDRLAFRVVPGERKAHLLRFIEREIWSKIPADQLGHEHDSSLDDLILGYGPKGA